MTKKTPRPSSTGRRHAPADQDNWRVKLQATRVKFDDIQKDIYLAEFRETGLKMGSAKAAGVSLQTVNNHIDNDPDFATAVEQAYQAYQDLLSAEVDRRGRSGFNEPIFFKGVRATEPILMADGSVKKNAEGESLFRYTSIQKFSDRMLELHAKRHIDAYRENPAGAGDGATGGVLLAPAGMTPEEAIAEAAEALAEQEAQAEKDAKEAAEASDEK